MNNPLKYTDPSGQCFWDLCIAEVSITEAIVTAVTVIIGAYIVSTDPEIPTIVDNTPPETVSEPMITPLDIVKDIINTTLPADESSSGPNVTTIPETSPSPSIESIPSQIAEKGINVMMQKDNRKIWSEGKTNNSLKNILNHWNKHKNEFPSLQNAVQYLNKANKFLNNPSKNTLQKKMSNGDTKIYDKSKNIFGIKDKVGTPKTMFKPKDKMEYWKKQ